jgi:hypothetical protein
MHGSEATRLASREAALVCLRRASNTDPLRYLQQVSYRRPPLSLKAASIVPLASRLLAQATLARQRATCRRLLETALRSRTPSHAESRGRNVRAGSAEVRG